MSQDKGREGIMLSVALEIRVGESNIHQASLIGPAKKCYCPPGERADEVDIY